MTQLCIIASQTLRLVALAAALAGPVSAVADDYGDVNQLIHSGKLSEALGKADQYLAAKPKDPQMRFLKGVIQTESGQPADAIATFTKLTEDYPELPEPYNNLAVLYAARSQFDKARASLELAIRTNPSYSTAHENLGDVYAKLASQAYSKALQLDSNNTAVPPKLALIRDLFAPVNKGKAPAATAAPVVAPTGSVKATVPARAASAAAVPAPSAAVPAASAAAKDVEAAINAWASAWSSKQVSGYLAAYAKEFGPPGNQSRKAWEQERRLRILGKSHISVKISNLAVSIDGPKAVARFKQRYSADTLNVSSRKTLELMKSGDRWLIVKETTGT